MGIDDAAWSDTEIKNCLDLILRIECVERKN